MFGRRETEPQIAIGTGRYGDPVLVDAKEFKKTSLILGTSQSGKTRLASSIADQHSRLLGCGQIVLDFKGDKEMVRRKAEVARQLGVPFLHFDLIEKAGGHYQPPHPYCPPVRAHYDPFSRGNGASKASMLLNSVPRDGDAAAYVRNAYEAVQLAWDIAALKGEDQRRTNGEPISGLEVLLNMLDPETIAKMGGSLTTEDAVNASGGSLSEAEAAQRIRRIQTRLETLKPEMRKSNSLLSSSMGDVSSLISTFLNSSSLGGNLTPGAASTMRIDLVRAILRKEIVVFSLPTQDYPATASQVGTMVLLDLQSAVSTLRTKRDQVARLMGASLSGADDKPWPPLVNQIEELGSIESEAAAAAMIGLFNKSADVGLRNIVSSQSIGDLKKVDDGRGVFYNQLLGQVDHMMTLQLTSEEDAEEFSKASGAVQKNMPIEEKQIERNRLKFGQGAGKTGRVRMNPEEVPRIPSDAPGSLRRIDKDDMREMLYINKYGKKTAVHTVGPEGSNNWYEVLRMVPVLEKPYGWNPFEDPDTANSEQEMESALMALGRDITNNAVLKAVLSTRADAMSVEAGTPRILRVSNAHKQPSAEEEPRDDEQPSSAALTSDGMTDPDSDAEDGLTDDGLSGPLVTADTFTIDDEDDPFRT